MTEGRKRLLAILVVICGVIVFALLVSVLTDSGQSSSPQAVPALSLKDLQGNPVNLEDYRGQVVLVNNFAVWCPPCRQEMPELEAYYRKHKDEGFVVLAVEAGGPPDQVKNFLKEMPLSFPVLSDPELKSVKAFRNNALPNSIVIDRQWKIRHVWVGGIDQAYLEKTVTPILQE